MDTPPLPDKRVPAEAVVVGGGPAGLRAAEVLAGAGCRVALYEGKPSVGRKFLVAGRGGLNLTHSEDLDRFVTRYGDEQMRWDGLLAEFGPAELRAWAEDLGVETYVGSSGRVFPRGQQAAVLLRRWVARLRTLGVEFCVNHRLEDLKREADGQWRLGFRDVRGDGKHEGVFRVVVLALGGASWPQTGSNGQWTEFLCSLGVTVAPWQAANCGWEVDWSQPFLEAAEGQPIKNIVVRAGGRTVAGELLVTRYGLEGGALYQFGRELRRMLQPGLVIDLKPGTSEEALFQRLPEPTKQNPTWKQLARCWRLGEAAAALLEFYGPEAGSHGRFMATHVKNLAIPLQRPRPIAEAISSAGGICWNHLSNDLELLHQPGLFVAGEMIDWEAPTGGYLLQGCFATGTRAGRAAAQYLSSRKIPSA